MSRCAGSNLLTGPCPWEAVTTVIAGCRHEHVQVHDVCTEHEGWLTNPDATSMCRPCYDMDGHLCELTVRRK